MIATFLARPMDRPVSFGTWRAGWSFENVQKIPERQPQKIVSGGKIVTINLKHTLGEAIKRERSLLGIPQEELARRSGLHRSYISDLEQGAVNPSVASILKVADALQVTVAELFGKA